MSILDRILLLLTGLLAAWQVAVGIEGAETLPLIAYTIGFGVLLVASLLIIILGFDALNSPTVVILSTLIPLSLSLGLVWEYWQPLRIAYLSFAIAGFFTVLVTRMLRIQGKLPVLVLAVVHGIAGIAISVLPILWALSGRVAPGFALVGVGGALIGIGGLLLSFLKTGRPILSRATILKVLPSLLLMMTAAFVVGFTAGAPLG